MGTSLILIVISYWKIDCTWIFVIKKLNQWPPYNVLNSCIHCHNIFEQKWFHLHPHFKCLVWPKTHVGTLLIAPFVTWNPDSRWQTPCENPNLDPKYSQFFKNYKRKTKEFHPTFKIGFKTWRVELFIENFFLSMMDQMHDFVSLWGTLHFIHLKYPMQSHPKRLDHAT